MEGKPTDKYPEYNIQEEDVVRSELTPEEGEEAIRQNALYDLPATMITDYSNLGDHSEEIIRLYNVPGHH